AARPHTSFYRVRKFVKRNRGLVNSLIAIAAILILGVISTSLGWMWALKERDRANIKSQESIQLAEKALTSQRKAEALLKATKVKSAWSDWKLGNVESAWETINSLDDENLVWENCFLRTEFSSSEHVLYGHASSIGTLELSEDRKWIASGSRDLTIRIWDAKTHEIVHEIYTDFFPTSIRFSNDSRSIFYSDIQNRVLKVDLKSLKSKVLAEFETDVLDIQLHEPSDSLFVSTNNTDRKISGLTVTELGTGTPGIFTVSMRDRKQVPVVLFEKEPPAKRVLVSQNRKLLITCQGNRIQTWKLNGKDQFQKALSMTKHASDVNDIAWNESEEFVVSGGVDKTVRVWDLETGEEKYSFFDHENSVTAVSVSPDGQKIASASEDRTIKIRNLKEDRVLKCQGHYDTVSSVEFLDNNRIVTCSDDFTVRIWDAQNRKSTWVNKVHQHTVWMACFVDDFRIASVSEEGRLCIHRYDTGKILNQYQSDCSFLSLAHDSRQNKLIVGDDLGRIHLIDLETFQPVRILNHPGLIWDVALSSDGQMLVSASSDQTVKIWNTNDWTMRKTISAHSQGASSARFSKDGKRLVTSGDDQTIRVWQTSDFTELASLNGHSTGIWRAVFSPDGTKIASSTQNGEIFIWDGTTYQLINQIYGHTNQVAGLAFSNQGNRLVSASDDRTIKIWDFNTGTELFVLRDKSDSEIIHVAFSPDGRKLISTNNRGWITVRVAENLERQPARPYLPNDAVETANRLMAQIMKVGESDEVCEANLQEALESICYFPSHESYAVAGACYYFQGRYNEAKKVLEKAYRLEKVVYGEPDFLPYIEAFLGLVYIELGNQKLADQYRGMFLAEVDDETANWQSHKDVIRLKELLCECFDE
ncbi:MAG: hypothetical protein AAF939_12990, partial [Planctomycetota bacterium]